MEAGTYMVIRNDVGDPLIMELTTGDVSWLMPRDAPVSCIKYFTHVTPQGKIYYENLVSNVVQWELPGSEEISDDARFVFESVLQMSREEVEQALSKTFDEQAVNRQMTEIDLHFYGQQTESEIDIAPVVVEKSSRRRNSVMDAPPPPSVQTSSSSPSASTSSAPSNGYNKNIPITPMQKMFDPIDNSNIRTISDIFSSTSSSTSSSSSSEDDRPQVLATVPPPVPALPVTPLRTKTTMHDDSMASHPPQPVKSSPHADNSSMDKDTGVSDDDVMERPSMSFNSRRVSARKPPLPPPREDPIVTQPQSYPVAASQRYPSAVDPSSQSFPTTAAIAAIAFAPSTTTAGEVASQSTSKLSASSEAVAATTLINSSSTYQQPAAVVRKTAADIDKKFKCGYLNKLAKRSGFNWKPRFCVLKNLHFVYYSDDKGESSYKGELSITPDTTAFSDKHDLRRGYLFKVVNQWETLLLAAASEVERSEWLKDLTRVINSAKKYLMCNCILLQTAKTSTSLLSSSSSDKKYFVLADGVLSYHPSNLKTNKLEGRIIISNKTSIEKMDDVNQIIAITDPNSFLNRISFQFKQIDADLRINPTEQYHLWRKELFRLIDPSRLTDGGPSSSSSSGSSDRMSISSHSSSIIIGSNSSFNALQVSTIRRASKRLSMNTLNDLSGEGTAVDDHLDKNKDDEDENEKQSSEFALNIQIPLKTGTLSKQSKKTLINWQMRYFELKPFNLIYFESEELRHLPRKEFQITVESKVVAVYKSDNTSRYSFKVSNQWDVLTLAAGTETERDNWIQNISLAISYITNCMFGYMVLIRPLLKNHRDKYYFIFGNGLISMHAGERQTSEVDGTFRFSNETVLDEVDDYNKIITLSDHSSSTSDLKTISFVFSYSDPNSKMHPSQLYKIWKTAIIRAMRPDALKKSVKNVRKDRDINGASIKLPSTGTAVGSKMNALEVVSNRRLSMNNMKAIVETHHDDNDDDDNGGDVDDDNFNAGLERPSFLALPPPPLPPHLTSRPLPTLPPPSNSISTPPLPRTTPTISSPPVPPVKPSTDNTIHQSLRRDDDVSNPPPLPPPMSPITTPLMSVPHLPTDSNTASRPPPPRPPSVMTPLSTISSPPPQSSSSTPSIPRPLPPQPPSVIPTPTPPPPPPLLSTNHLHLANNDSTNNPPRPLPPALPMVASSHQSTDSTTSPRPPPPPPPISRQPPPSALSSLSSSSTPFTSPQLHNDRPPPPTASPLRVIPSASTDNDDDDDDDDLHASERNTNLSIDAYYDGKQNSTSDSFKGEMMTNESRANLKLQLARLKESNEQSSYIAANTTVSSPVAKAEVNPLLHSFQAQSNPLTRQRSPFGKTDASPNATSTD